MVTLWDAILRVDGSCVGVFYLCIGLAGASQLSHFVE